MARIRSELGPLSLGRLAPAWERTILLEVARTIAASSRGAGALLEQRSDVPVVQIWASEVDVRRAVELSIQRLPARLSTESLAPTPAWSGTGPEWSIEVEPARDVGPGPSELPGGSPERVRYRGDLERAREAIGGTVDWEPRPLEVPPSLRWAAQTHWISDGSGAVRAHHRFRLASDPEAPGRTNLFQWALARHFGSTGYPPVRVRVQRTDTIRRWHWDTGRLGGRSRKRTFRVRAEEAARGLVPRDRTWELDDPTGTHTVVLGASGTGKTSFLAQVGRREIVAGRSVIAFDLHGDLAPRLTSGLGPEAQARILGVDASGPVERIPGLAVIGSAPPGQEEREAAFLVAALRRLSSDGNELYWGFRLERIFDTFVRLTQETGGTLLDLYALLTEARRRQSARWSSRSPTSIGFLDELGPLLQRNPEFLWPAAARVAKVALVPAVAALLAPAEEGIAVRRLLSEGRSIIWRLPFGVLGPETSAFVASLIAGRIYLDRTGLSSSETRPVLFLIDEAQAFAPRVLAEILSEGRKFGLRALIATQYPERMAPDLRSAAQGTVSTHVVFRVPPAGAVSSGSWVGLDRAEAQQLLPQLPVGWAVVASSVRRSLTPMTLDDGGLVPSSEPWAGIVSRSAARSNEGPAHAPTLGEDPVIEALLLAIFGLTEEGRPADRTSIVSRLGGTPGLRSDPEGASGLLSTLQRRGWAEEAQGVWTVTRAGLELLGFSAHTGATSESVEHRQLLLEAFRIFARKGCHLRILRQGRFDRRTPDALLPQLPSEWQSRSAREAVQLLDQVKVRWAWRFFGGRDVFVEAEVSGARRSDRIRHGLDKADHEGAFPLFLVSDAKKAQFVRRVLRAADRSPARAQVWTLPLASSARKGVASTPGPGAPSIAW
jgi:hypothetical protein